MLTAQSDVTGCCDVEAVDGVGVAGHVGAVVGETS